MTQEKSENGDVVTAGCNGETPLIQMVHQQGDPEPFPSVDKECSNSFLSVFILCISVASVMLSTGIAVGSLNCAKETMEAFYGNISTARYNETLGAGATKDLIALTFSMMLAGGFFGALSIGVVLPLISRQQAMVLMNCVNLLAVFLISIGGRFIPSYESVIAGRFIMGLFCGFGMNLIPIVVAETSAPSKQAFYLSLIGVDLSFGGLIGLCLGFEALLGSAKLWPVLLSMSALPSLAYLMWSPWLPETPSYLLRQGQRLQAIATFRLLRDHPTQEQIEVALQKITKEQQIQGTIQRVTFVEMVTRPHYRRLLFVVLMVYIQSQLCGINGIGMYTRTIFIQAGFSAGDATSATSVVYSVQFVVALVGSVAVDRWGPKRNNVVSSFVMSASLVVLTISLATRSVIPAMKIVSVVAVTIYVLAWACGVNLTLFPMLAAFTTESTRETAFFIGGAVFWVLSWFVTFIFPYLIELDAYAYLPYAVVNLVFAIYVLTQLPETTGVSPEEVRIRVQGLEHTGQTNGGGTHEWVALGTVSADGKNPC